MHIVMKREVLLERLNERLKAAEAEDRRVEKAHKADEAKALKAFRNRLREALKWDYEMLKENYFRCSLDNDRPSCPRREANQIARVINMVKLDTRTSAFRIKDDSDIGRALSWVPASERPALTVC